MIPSLFRPELWHPLTVHFPIGLLVFGTLLRLVGAAGFERRFFFSDSGKLAIFAGALSAWVAWYTGGRAEEEVNSRMCDPTLTHLHGDLAFYVTLIFSAVAIIDLVTFFMRSKPQLSFLKSMWFQTLLLLVCIGGTGLLSYVGHIGAGLTYNQAAGVYVPTPQCTEFAE